MTSIKVSDISVSPTPVQMVASTVEGRHVKPLFVWLPGPSCDLLTDAHTPSSHGMYKLHKPNKDEPIISLYQSVSAVGTVPDLTNCHHSLLLSSFETSLKPFFHGTCILLAKTDVLYTTSDLLQTKQPHAPAVLMSRIKLTRQVPSAVVSHIMSLEWEKIRPPSTMAFPSGAIPYAKGTIFCSQGNMVPNTGGLFYVPEHLQLPTPLVTNFYSRDLNSPHEVAVAPDDETALWFTDPCYGYEQGFRQQPVFPPRLYRFVPGTTGSGHEGGDLRVMADGLKQPMGLDFSPDGRTLYVSDAGLDGDISRSVFRSSMLSRPILPCAFSFPDIFTCRYLLLFSFDVSNPISLLVPSCLTFFLLDIRVFAQSISSELQEYVLIRGSSGVIYAYDVIARGDAPFLSNKRLFAVPVSGCPSTVRCDEHGYVYVGCSDGIECWSAGGTLQAVIEVPGKFTQSTIYCSGFCVTLYQMYMR